VALFIDREGGGETETDTEREGDRERSRERGGERDEESDVTVQALALQKARSCYGLINKAVPDTSIPIMLTILFP